MDKKEPEKPSYTLSEKKELPSGPFIVKCPCELYFTTNVCPATGKKDRFKDSPIMERPVCSYFIGRKIKDTGLSDNAIDRDVVFL